MNEVLVLCYHAVSPTWTAPLSVTPDALERQLSSLLARGWRPATFREAVLNSPTHRTLAVTFDDAFASVGALARPILSALRIRATVFVPTAFMSQRGPLAWEGTDHWLQTADAAELTSMDWDDLGELSMSGWEIGSHTRTHPRLPALRDDELRDELGRSREEISQHLGSACVSIAYPYGGVDDRVAQMSHAAGYRVGAGLSSSLRNRGPLRWPRVGIYHVDSGWRFGLKMAPAMRTLRASRLWPKRD